MKISRKTALRLDVLLSGFVFLNVLITAVIGIVYGAGDGQAGTDVIGLGYLIPYTMDSNLLAGVSALILLCFGIRNLRTGQDRTPMWAAKLRLMAASSLSLTFVIAALFLAPGTALTGGSYFTVFSKDMFCFHLVNPVLTFFSFVFLGKSCRFSKRDILIGFLPTFLYGLVYLTMVVFLKRWADFYNFTFGGHYALVPVVMAVIYGLACGLSALLIFLHNRALEQ